jgi:outer membrane protein
MFSNTRIPALVFGLGLAASTAGLAQGTSAAAGSAAGGPAKVGIVGIQEAIASTNEGKKELDALQQRFAGKQKELKALNDEVEALKKQLQTQGDKLSEEARASSAKTIETKTKTLQRNYDDYQSEIQQAEQEVLNRLGGKMLNVLDKYASANGYSVILDVSSQQSPVLWASKATNITKELVDAYNQESPAAPSAKPAGSAGAAGKPAGNTGAAASKPAGVAAPVKRP